MTSSKIRQYCNVILDNTILHSVSQFVHVLIDESLTCKCHFDCVSKHLSRKYLYHEQTEILYSRTYIIYSLFCLLLWHSHSRARIHVRPTWINTKQNKTKSTFPTIPFELLVLFFEIMLIKKS